MPQSVVRAARLPRLLTRSAQPQGAVPLSDRLLSAARFCIGVYSPRLGLVNGFGRGPQSITRSSGLGITSTSVGRAWALGGGEYVEIGNPMSLLNRSSTESQSYTIIAIASLTSAGSYPMLLSAWSGSYAPIELRGNISTGRPELVISTTAGGEQSVSTPSSIVGTGMRAIVASFRGAMHPNSTPSRPAIWCGNEFAEANVGAGDVRTTSNNWRLGVRAGGTSYPWSGALADLIILNGAIPDSLAAEIARSPQDVYRICFAPQERAPWIPGASLPSIYTGTPGATPRQSRLLGTSDGTPASAVAVPRIFIPRTQYQHAAVGLNVAHPLRPILHFNAAAPAQAFVVGGQTTTTQTNLGAATFSVGRRGPRVNCDSTSKPRWGLVGPASASSPNARFDRTTFTVVAIGSKAAAGTDNYYAAFGRGNGSNTPSKGWLLGFRQQSGIYYAVFTCAGTQLLVQAGSVGRDVVVVGVADGSLFRLYAEGGGYAEAAFSATTYEYDGSADRAVQFGYVSGTLPSGATSGAAGAAWMCEGAADAVQARSLAENPWQLLAPQDRGIWLPYVTA